LDDWAIDIACRSKINYVYANECSAELLLQVNKFNHDLLLYYKFNENNFSIMQDGFIVDGDKIDDEEKYFANLDGCRNYLYQLPFYPKDKTIPIILDLWD
jgi:hypothetical protein